MSYAFATPRIPFADATTTGLAADAGGAVDADNERVSVKPAAAAAPAPRNSRREIVISD